MPESNGYHDHGGSRKQSGGKGATLSRSLPLYTGLGYRNDEENQGICKKNYVNAPHPGLVFDKCVDTWEWAANSEFHYQKPTSGKNDSRKAKFGGKHAFFDEAAMRGCSAAAGLQGYRDRRQRLLAAIDGVLRSFHAHWRFASGLGAAHPYEAGFVWHRTLGVPYLPGSSVKGLIRTWVEQWNPESWNTFKHLFGDTDKDGAGALIVFDAIPEEAPKLEVDIMNPHYGDYYQDPTNNPPADYLSPKPVFFLAVADGAKFSFALAPRRPGASEEDKNQAQANVKKGFELLCSALKLLGIGAKTAAGYGRFSEDLETKFELEKQISLQQEQEEKGRIAAEAEQRRAKMSPLKAELDQWLSLPQQQVEMVARGWLERMEQAEEEDARIIAQEMKGFYESTRRWTGGSKKHKGKIRKIKAYL